MFLALAVGIALVAMVGAMAHTGRLKTALAQKTVTTSLPRFVEAAILAVQAGELVKVVEHASMVNMVAALLILAIVLAARSGTKSELR